MAASGDLVVHKYVEELTYGVTPAAALTKLAVVSSSIDAAINSTVSNQINPNRSENDLILTDGSSAGGIEIEWMAESYDPFIEGALGNDFVELSYTATTIDAASGDNSINAAATFPATILPGHKIRIAGFATPANNGLATVVSATTSKIILSGLTLVTEAAGASVTISGRNCRNGVLRKSFSLEKEFVGTSPVVFVSHKGMVVNTLSINAANGSIVTGSIEFMGTTSTYSTATIGVGAENAMVVNDVFSPTSSIGTIYVDGAPFTSCVQNLSLTLNNGARNLNCLGSLYPQSVNLSTLNISGTLDIYFNDYAMIDKFLNGQSISLEYSFDDIAGNTLNVFLPRCKFNSASVSGIAKGNDVQTSLAFTALYDSGDGFAAQISSLPV